MPMASGRPNCSITVNGSWWRPTVSMPNRRSDGARRTGAASSAVTVVASAATATISATRPAKVDYRGEDQHRTGDRPAADIAHLRDEAGVAGEGLQHEQA